MHDASEVHYLYAGMRKPIEIDVLYQLDTKYWKCLFFVCVYKSARTDRRVRIRLMHITVCAQPRGCIFGLSAGSQVRGTEGEGRRSGACGGDDAANCAESTDEKFTGQVDFVTCQLMGFLMGFKAKRPERGVFACYLAERASALYLISMRFFTAYVFVPAILPAT